MLTLLPVGLVALVVESYMPKDRVLTISEGLLLLPSIWLGLSFVAALPLFQAGTLSLVDAWFIAVSGITTTGAEILADLSVLPESLLYYRMWLQFLGGLGTGDRPTGNLCTPGTDVDMNFEKVKNHCTRSNSDTYDNDDWVEAEIIVYSDSIAHHLINGKTVLTYTNLRYGDDGRLPENMIHKKI